MGRLSSSQVRPTRTRVGKTPGTVPVPVSALGVDAQRHTAAPRDGFLWLPSLCICRAFPHCTPPPSRLHSAPCDGILDVASGTAFSISVKMLMQGYLARIARPSWLST